MLYSFLNIKSHWWHLKLTVNFHYCPWNWNSMKFCTAYKLKIALTKLFFPYRFMKDIFHFWPLIFLLTYRFKKIPKGKKISAKMARGRGGGGSRDRGRRSFGRGGRKTTGDLARKRRQYQEFGEAHPVEEKDLNLKRRKARCFSFSKARWLCLCSCLYVFWY